METEFQASDGCEDVNRITPDFMKCPSAAEAQRLHQDASTAYENLAKGNYAACLGSGSYLESIEGNTQLDDRLRKIGDEHFAAAESSRGVITVRMIPNWIDRVKADNAQASGASVWKFAHGKGTKVRNIKDGTSYSIILSEVLSVDDSEGFENRYSKDIRGVWASPSMGASTYTHGHPKSPTDHVTRIPLPPNSSGTMDAQRDNINSCARSIPDDSPLVCVGVPPQGNDAGNTWAAARSSHPGGVIAGRADGSVGFYPDGTDGMVWYALGTRAARDRIEE
jgi:hypothetical protein